LEIERILTDRYIFFKTQTQTQSWTWIIIRNVKLLTTLTVHKGFSRKSYYTTKRELVNNKIGFCNNAMYSSSFIICEDFEKKLLSLCQDFFKDLFRILPKFYQGFSLFMSKFFHDFARNLPIRCQNLVPSFESMPDDDSLSRFCDHVLPLLGLRRPRSLFGWKVKKF